MTTGYAEVTFSLDFKIFSISQVSQAVHVNFTSVHSVATSNTTIGLFLIPCTNNNKVCVIFYTLDKDDYGFFTKASSN